MKILSIVGARPQFVKAAVVSRAMRNMDGMKEVLLHTGQHYDACMSQVFFDEMDIPAPDYNLGIGGGTHGRNTGRMIEKIEEALLIEKPDRVLVYGDTDSTLAGALAAVKLHIPLAHVEAGLRSFNRTMPEEINRVLTDHAADLLFAPTDAAVANLKAEGIAGDKVVRTGDVMYDAALYYRARTKRPATLDLPDGDFALCTVHRQENTDDPKRLRGILDALTEIADCVPVVFPLHPRTRKAIERHGFDIGSRKGLIVLDPVSYLEMVWLLEHCQTVMTDSGGMQKEAYFFQKPCVTLREETEWVELVDAGANVLAGADKDKIVNAVNVSRQTHVLDTALYGDGQSAQRIVDSVFLPARNTGMSEAIHS
jgi:UDP-GlcNAc3NAcA epimerase